MADNRVRKKNTKLFEMVLGISNGRGGCEAELKGVAAQTKCDALYSMVKRKLSNATICAKRRRNFMKLMTALTSIGATKPFDGNSTTMLLSFHRVSNFLFRYHLGMNETPHQMKIKINKKNSR